MTDENTQSTQGVETADIDYKAEYEKAKAKEQIAVKEAIDLRKKLEPIKKSGVSLDELPNILSRYDELNSMASKAEEERARKAGEFDVLLKKRDEEYAKQLHEKELQIKALSAAEREIRVQNGLMQALTKANATQAGVELLPRILESRVKIDTVDGVRKVIVLDEAGEMPMLTKSGQEATIDDLVESISGKYPDLFKGVIKSGSGKQPNSQGAGSTKTITRASFDALSDHEKRELVSNGTQITD